MIKCKICKKSASSGNDSPEMIEWIFWWCDKCDNIVIPSADEAEAEVAKLANQPYQYQIKLYFSPPRQPRKRIKQLRLPI